MSAAYHVCPSGENLQFDVVFIYVSLVGVVLKNYHVSHSDFGKER